MSDKIIPLHQLPLGNFGRVKTLLSDGNIRKRMLDLGLIENTTVVSLYRSPSGDPTAYQIRGAVIALRSEEAEKILVEAF